MRLAGGEAGLYPRFYGDTIYIHTHKLYMSLSVCRARARALLYIYICLFIYLYNSDTLFVFFACVFVVVYMLMVFWIFSEVFRILTLLCCVLRVSRGVVVDGDGLLAAATCCHGSSFAIFLRVF